MSSLGRTTLRSRTRLIPFFVGLFVFAYPWLLSSQSLPVPEGTKCAECGMTVDQNSKSASAVITKDDKNLFFCDIGDMLFHFRANREKIKEIYVRDYATGERIDGRKAFYVFNKKIATPMSWGIAAFADKSSAERWGAPLDFDGAFTLLK